MNEMKIHKNRFVRFAWMGLGSFFVVLGCIGIFIPGLPTTIFLILASGCYIRSSRKFYDRLLNNRYLGKYIKDYREGKGMSKKSKIFAIVLMIVFCGYAVVFVIPNIWLQIIVSAVGLIGFWYVGFRVPTR